MVYRHKFLPGVVAREVTVIGNGRVQFDRVDTTKGVFRLYGRLDNFGRLVRFRKYVPGVYVTRSYWPLEKFRQFFETGV